MIASSKDSPGGLINGQRYDKSWYSRCFRTNYEPSLSLLFFVIDKQVACSTNLGTILCINLLKCSIYNAISMQETFVFVNYKFMRQVLYQCQVTRIFFITALIKEPQTDDNNPIVNPKRIARLVDVTAWPSILLV